jgi:hypothetical protein
VIVRAGKRLIWASDHDGLWESQFMSKISRPEPERLENHRQHRAPRSRPDHDHPHEMFRQYFERITPALQKRFVALKAAVKLLDSVWNWAYSAGKAADSIRFNRE